MGKVKMELIRDEKSRISTFKKRKKCLIQKTQELATLCDVKACIIIQGPFGSEIWPRNADETRRIIEAKKRDSGSKKFDLCDYFRTRKMEAEKELSKLRHKNKKEKYPVPTELLNLMSEFELREFGTQLRTKAEFVKSRIQLMRNLQQGIGYSDSRFNLYDDRTMFLTNGDGFGAASSSSIPSCNYYSEPGFWQNDDGDLSLDDLVNYHLSYEY